MVINYFKGIVKDSNNNKFGCGSTSSALSPQAEPAIIDSTEAEPQPNDKKNSHLFTFIQDKRLSGHLQCRSKQHAICNCIVQTYSLPNCKFGFIQSGIANAAQPLEVNLCHNILNNI